MKQFEDKPAAAQAGLPQEIASAVNLMAHPLAGAAAMGALGFGMASHAFGLWLGAMAGATEASRRMFEAPSVEPEVAAANVRRAKLRLVEKTPVPAGKTARVTPVAVADDLKAISGIGPKLEKVLNGLGVRSYADVASLDAARISEIESALGFAGRIGRDDWVGQAKALSGQN